jgi:hypothetical protein
MLDGTSFQEIHVARSASTHMAVSILRRGTASSHLLFLSMMVSRYVDPLAATGRGPPDPHECERIAWQIPGLARQEQQAEHSPCPCCNSGSFSPIWRCLMSYLATRLLLSSTTELLWSLGGPAHGWRRKLVAGQLLGQGALSFPSLCHTRHSLHLSHWLYRQHPGDLIAVIVSGHVSLLPPMVRKSMWLSKAAMAVASEGRDVFDLSSCQAGA